MTKREHSAMNLRSFSVRGEPNRRMSDDATVYFGYTVNSVAVCSLGCCYGHHVVQRRFVESEPSILEDASNAGFPNFRITLDPSHFSFMPNEISQLARDIAEQLRAEGLAAGADVEEAVQRILDKVETVGGFDLTTYEDDDDDEDDEDDEFTEEELDDRWDDDDDEDEDEEQP